jgi:Xaa-Pro aminopeptidase
MSDRLIHPVSDQELARRWAGAAEVMRVNKVDALVLQNSNDWMGGYSRWFTGIPPSNGYPRTVIFFGPADMIVIEMGGRGERRKPDPDDILFRGVTEVRTNPSFSTVLGTLQVDARMAADALAERGCKRIGWVNPDGMYFTFARALEQDVEGGQFVDVTDDIDRFKAVKSAEEQEMIRLTCKLQDDVMEAVSNFIKPGLQDYEIAAFAQYEAQKLGSEQGIYLGSSAHSGAAAVFRPRHAQGRKIEHGDVFSFLVEVNGPGGMYAELGRTFSLGRPSNALVVANKDAQDAQKVTRELLKPGVTVKAIFEKHNEYMRSRGLPEEKRLHCHGQGYDLVERPLIRDDDDMLVLEGMNITIHPGYVNDEAFALACDNYMVGAEGVGECLHRTSQDLIII